MSISPHLHRKLQETLGADAADDLVERMEGFDAIRGDVSELRHEIRLVETRLDARISTTEARLEGKLAEGIGRLEGLITANRASIEALVEKGLREQTRFFFVAWSVLLTVVVGLYAR